MFRKYLIAAAAVIAVLATSTNADAAFRMRLEVVGGNGVVVTDNNNSGTAGDTNPTVGFMNVNANLGGGVTIVTGIGYQQPPIGGLAGDQVAGLDLSGTTIQTAGAATVVLSLQATGYTGGIDGLIAALNAVGGTTNALTNMTFKAWIDPTNAVQNYGAVDVTTPAVLAGKGVVPGTSVAATPLVFNTAASFNGNTQFSFLKSGAYSLSVEATLVFNGATTVSFDNHLTASVPEPMTIVAAMTGLPFLGGFVLRRRKAATLSV